jgi:hypothetical protein
MSVNKMGSKLAQGVRHQVMGKQVKSPEVAKKAAAPRVAAGTAQPASVTKATSAAVNNKTQIAQQAAAYEILHPSRVWPD